MKEILLKYIEGKCTDPEKVIVTNWLDEDPTNMKEYLALRKLNDILIWQPDSITKPSAKIQKKKYILWQNKYLIEALKIAAVFVIAILVSHYFFNQSADQVQETAMQIMHVPAGQRAGITLEDGTQVWLNAKSTLTFPNHFSANDRVVKLDGEGFFEVAHNKSKPFIVKTGKYDVKVLGTKFNLMAYSERGNFETSLLEGLVEVMEAGKSKGVTLKPDERIFLKNNQFYVAPIIQPDHFLWKDGILSFEDESFPEIISKLELYFDIKIVTEKNNPFNFRCTGKFRTKDGVEHILKVLQLSNKFDYAVDYRNNTITIK